MITHYSGINVSPRPFGDNDEYVIGVSLRFHTKDNDKDYDTSLDIRLCNKDGVLFAERTGISGHWAEKTSYLVALDLKNALLLSQVSEGSVHLAIHPNGTDTWEFKYDLWIFYSNNGVTVKHWNGKILSQNATTTTLPR